MKRKKLSNSEEMLLHIFWKSETPLSALDVFEISQKSDESSSWSINYIHKMLTALLDKEVLEICGFVREGRKYVRKFSPCLTKDEFIADMLEQQGVDSTSFAKIAMAFVKRQDKKKSDEGGDDLIAELEQMISKFEKSEDMNN